MAIARMMAKRNSRPISLEDFDFMKSLLSDGPVLSQTRDLPLNPLTLELMI